MPRPAPPRFHEQPGVRPKVVVFGSRGVTDYALVKKKLDRILFNLVDPIILHGATPKHKNSVDWLAEKWAHYNWCMVMRFPPDLRKHGSPAGFHVRNREMVQYLKDTRPGLRFAVAFYDGDSTGTKSMIGLVRAAKIPLRVVQC